MFLRLFRLVHGLVFPECLLVNSLLLCRHNHVSFILIWIHIWIMFILGSYEQCQYEHLHTSLWVDICFLWIDSEEKNCWLYGKFMFNFLRKFHTFLHIGCFILHLHLQNIRIPIFPHHCLDLLLSVFMIIVILVGV